MKTVVIAEKPSMAKNISDALGRQSPYTVVAALGHLIELSDPDYYVDAPINPKTNKKRWMAKDLPIIPEKWHYETAAKGGAQLKKIKDALVGADRVIHAGDPDREGQRIVDLILAALGFRGPVDRVWLKALDEGTIRKAFNNLRPNSEPQYQNLSDASDARAKADWLVGMNLTRAMTIANRSMISIGRVQTALLAMMAARQREVENFKPVDYFNVFGLFSGGLRGRFEASDEQKNALDWFDTEGRLVSKSGVDDLIKRITGKKATVIEYSEKKRATPAPLPFDLRTLQAKVGKMLGLSAKDTLAVAQSLYMAKFTSYPRTDWRHLPEELMPDAPATLSHLRGSGFNTDTNPSLKHAAWDNSKVGAHYGIIPTTVPAAGSLSGDEEAVYKLIARSYVGLFMPDAIDLVQKLVLEVDGFRFIVRGKRQLQAGWRVLYGAEENEDGDEELGGLQGGWSRGDQLDCTGGEAVASKTTPPPLFSDANVTEYMAQAHLFVTDPKARATLRETSGIGTPATAGDFPEKLIDRKFIERRDGKTKKAAKIFHVTELGFALIDALGDSPVTKVENTARWEDMLTDIAEGRGSKEAFLNDIKRFVIDEVANTRRIAGAGGEDRPTAPCPVCSGTATRMKSKTSERYFWACDNKNGDGTPVHGLLSDDNGKPGQPFEDKPKPAPVESDGNEPKCPKCKVKVVRRLTGSSKPYFRCTKCNSAWWPDFNDKDKLGKIWS